MKKLFKIFFDKFYWLQHPEAKLRYLPVVSILKKSEMAKRAKILEIGSGSFGIVPYLKRKIDGLDYDFSGPQTDLLNRIYGTADKLPFRRNSYDIVIAVDVLEHIPNERREKSIYEMLRVARRMVVLVVPSSEKSMQQDQSLQKRWNKLFKYENQFLEEHVRYGLPKIDEVLVAIDRSLRNLTKKAKVRSEKNLNLHIRKLLMLTWITKNKYLYYLYLKGYLLLVPLLRFANFGNCYRRIFVIEFPHENRH